MPTITTINDSGIVTIVGAGTSTITATIDSDGNYSSASDSDANFTSLANNIDTKKFV